MKLEECTVDQLTAILDDIDRERLALKERGRQIMEIRKSKVAVEQAEKKARLAAVQRASVTGIDILAPSVN